MAEMNPLLLAKVAPYAIAALIAFALAWGIQSLRLTSAKLEVKEVQQEYTAFRQEQTRIFQEARDAADKQRVEAATQYAIARQELADAVAAGDVYRRCVEAGRCGVPRNPPSLCESSTSRSGGGLSAPNKSDGSSANAVSLAGDATAINDCAVTTLQLNHLQQDIEEQPGYSQ